MPHDRDADGLCDATEARAGTDPDEWDTDGDGMPDTAELIAAFDANDPISPGPDQIVYLGAQNGRMISFEVRSTVDGGGAGVTGQFVAHGAFDPNDRTASDYFIGGTALGAEPPDNVREMQPQSEHFGKVSGKTRLRFSVAFAYGSDQALDCALTLPFEYAVKSDIGGYLTSRFYALIVTPWDGEPSPTDFCQPVSCL